MRKLALIAIMAAFGAAPWVSAGTIFTDSFELPAITSKYHNYSGTLVTGSATWVVTNNVDIINSIYAGSTFSPSPYPNGVQAIDLNGTLNGSISTDIATVIGQAYSLNFYLSDNSRVTASTNAGAGNVTQNFTSTKAGWAPYSMSFTATGTSTTISFASVSPSGNSGPTLDNISVATVPVPASALAGVALLGLVAVGDKFRLRRSI